jgi:hypothetical protein
MLQPAAIHSSHICEAAAHGSLFSTVTTIARNRPGLQESQVVRTQHGYTLSTYIFGREFLLSGAKVGDVQECSICHCPTWFLGQRIRWLCSDTATPLAIHWGCKVRLQLAPGTFRSALIRIAAGSGWG